MRGVEAMENSGKVRAVPSMMICNKIFGLISTRNVANSLSEREFARMRSFWLPRQWDGGGLLRPVRAPGED